jgi:hypothetical protein
MDVLSRIAGHLCRHSPKRRLIEAQRAPEFASDDMTTISPYNEIWRYSKQYSLINTEGGHKPPPAFGSPTLVWHLGVWQRWDADELETAPRDDVISSRFDHFDKHNSDFFCEIRDFIENIQKRGRIRDADSNNDPDSGIETLTFRQPKGVNPDISHVQYENRTHPFHVCEPQSLDFTLWWQDSDADGAPILNQRQSSPDYSALRVRVQAQTHMDHVTLSFFIDAAKPYGHPQIYSTESKDAANFGRRRHKIATYLERMREICESQIKYGFVERDRLPEQLYPLPKRDDFNDGLSFRQALLEHKEKEKKAAADLREIANYLYEDIWRDFLYSFDLKLPTRDIGENSLSSDASASSLRHGKIFANFRGLLMSVKGVETDRNSASSANIAHIRERLRAPTPESPLESEANPGFGKFLVFDADSGEPNTVLKSLWPFMRRVIPWADYRDFVGCGILGWRALYITAPGAAASFYDNQETPGRLHELPAGSPSDSEKPGPHTEWAAMRYLVVTKGEPHREQIGRFVERINALRTMRLFALKNLRVIKNAGTHLRILGHELDGVLHKWSVERGRIEQIYQPLLELARKENSENHHNIKIKIRNWVEWLETVYSPATSPGIVIERRKHRRAKSQAELDIEHYRADELGELIRVTEQKLIQLTSALDSIGRGGAGRILYVINRSNYYCNEFERLWPTLEIGDIEGWINYGQFVERGVKPTFNLIRHTGQRLIWLRKRLISITEMIQTSALIIETEATKSNTAQLSRIATSLYYVEIPLVFVAGSIIINLAGRLGISEGVRTIAGSVGMCGYLVYRHLTRHKAMRNTAPPHQDGGASTADGSQG